MRLKVREKRVEEGKKMQAQHHRERERERERVKEVKSEIKAKMEMSCSLFGEHQTPAFQKTRHHFKNK